MIEVWSVALSTLRFWGIASISPFILGLSAALFFAGCFNNERRIQSLSEGESGFLAPERKAWKREIPLLLRFSGFTGLWAALTDQLRTRGVIPLERSLVNGSLEDTIWTVVQQFAVYFIVFDAYYYFLHRYVLHSKRLLWWVHEFHHR